MFKKKPLFIVFEGIEGSGKSYLSKKLHLKLKKIGLTTIHTREPGGTTVAENIRKVILKDYFQKKTEKMFDKYTDTLLYLASRNEHVLNKIKPALNKKKIVICDRFIDSTIAYQVDGKKVNKNFINLIHKYILHGTKPDLVFVLKVNLHKAFSRLKKRTKKNRYDKFPKSFFLKAQKSFIKIANANKKKYYILDNSKDDKNIEKKIFNIVISKLKNI